MLSSRLPLINPLVVLSILLSTGACGTLRPGTTRAGTTPGRVITAEEIKKSGAVDAWEVLRKTGTYLSLRESYSGAPVRMTRRGRSSIYLDETPVVIVDGVRLIDFRALQQIRAQAISTVRILTGVEATAWHGNSAGGGAIVIETKSGPE